MRLGLVRVRLGLVRVGENKKKSKLTSADNLLATFIVEAEGLDSMSELSKFLGFFLQRNVISWRDDAFEYSYFNNSDAVSASISTNLPIDGKKK